MEIVYLLYGLPLGYANEQDIPEVILLQYEGL